MHHRRLSNETDVQHYLTTSGFEMIQPEAISFADQVQLFSEAAIVVGSFGAGLTNAAFMPHGSALLELAPPIDEARGAHNAIFSTLCGLRGLRYGLVVGDQFDRSTADFRMPIAWLNRLLSHFVA